MGQKNDPAYNGIAVPDATETEIDFRALYVGGAGDLVIQHEGNPTPTTYVAAAAGYHPLQGEKILAATTATSVVALK